MRFPADFSLVVHNIPKDLLVIIKILVNISGKLSCSGSMVRGVQGS